MNTFGELLRNARTRIKPKPSAKKVAEVIGVSHTIIYDYENNKKTPSIETVTKLAEYYNDDNLVKEYYKLAKNLRNEVVHARLDKLMNRDPNAILAVMEFIEKYENR